MILAKDGKTRYAIVYGENVSAAVKTAARELADYLRKISGAEPAIVPGGDRAGRRIILEEGGAGLKNDGYRIQTRDEALYITGENGRGTLYGVYGFLEKYLGCRFLAPDVEIVPRLREIRLENTNETVIPPLEYRETFWYGPQHDAAFAVKRGFNGQLLGGLDEELGGGVRYLGFAHTLFSYVSPDEYFDTHPEYFSMINGKRIRERTQLCLTNPDVLAITRRKLRRNIMEHPDCRIFSLTQMDWYNPCTCPECARVDAEEGSHSGTLLRFVNACAASVAEEFPDVVIDTFAYQYTRQPPRLTRPLPNVCVRICTIECCRNHPVSECGEIMYPFRDRINSADAFRDDLRNWAKICSRMFIWDYTTNYRFYLAPFPNFHVLGANIRFFLENGVTGIFEQGNAQAVSGEFGELRAYMISRLMWEPQADEEKIMCEFLEGYYGRAAVPIRKYIRLLREDVPRQKAHIGIYDDPGEYLSQSFLDEADRLWDEAENLAENEAELRRIRKSRLSVRFAKARKTDPAVPGRAEDVEKLIGDIRAFGIGYIRESQKLEDSFDILRRNEGY